MSAIFISYRRDDSAAYAGRLYDRLAQRFGSKRVFMDIDTIEPGHDFAQVIARKVASAGVVLVLIGKRWLDCIDEHGTRRLENRDDFVRMEILAALKQQRRVVPVLVGQAPMPEAKDLPEVLQALAARNAFEVSDARFHYDTDRLMDAIAGDLGYRVRMAHWAARRKKAVAIGASIVVTGAIVVGLLPSVGEMTRGSTTMAGSESWSEPASDSPIAPAPLDETDLTVRSSPSLDVETLKLKRLIDKQSQLAGMRDQVDEQIGNRAREDQARRLRDLSARDTYFPQPSSSALGRVGNGALGALLQADSGGRGVRVLEVTPDGPADAAGIRSGDVITEFQLNEVRSPPELMQWVRAAAPGQRVEVSVLRDGMTKHLEVVIGDSRGQELLNRRNAQLDQLRQIVDHYNRPARDVIDSLGK